MLRVGVAVRAAQNGNSGDRRAGAAGWRVRSRRGVWCRARPGPDQARCGDADIAVVSGTGGRSRGPVCRRQAADASAAGVRRRPGRPADPQDALGPAVPRDLVSMAGLGRQQAGAARQFRCLRARAAVTGVSKYLAGRGEPRAGVGHPVRVRAGPGPKMGRCPGRYRR